MDKKTLNALHWIVSILNKNHIPYRIGGGLAAKIYGSGRAVNDIDISLPGTFFPIIVSEARDYIVSGPEHYTDEKWDCDALILNYEGQEIDMTDINTLRMKNKERTEWFQTKDNFQKLGNIIVTIDGVKVSLIHPRELVEYKKELDGDHQIVDIEAVQKYIVEHQL